MFNNFININKKKNSGTGFGRHKNIAWLNLLMGSQPSLDNWISNGNTGKKSKTCTNSLALKKIP